MRLRLIALVALVGCGSAVSVTPRPETAPARGRLEAEQGPPGEPADPPSLEGRVAWHDGFDAKGWNALLNRGSTGGRDPSALAWGHSQMQGEYSARLVTSPRRAGRRAIRFEWRDGLPIENNTSKKAFLWAPPAPQPDVERWWGFSMFVPSHGMKRDTKAEILAQWHGTRDERLGEAPRNPAISLGVKRDNLQLSWIYDERRVTPPRFRDWDRGTVRFGELPKDRWIDFVFHIRWDPFGDGLLEAWMDGKKQVDAEDIPLGFNDDKGPFFGIGIYKWPAESDHRKRVVYFDEVRCAGPDGSYEQVVPRSSEGG